MGGSLPFAKEFDRQSPAFVVASRKGLKKSNDRERNHG
jgi:hypothetical protein